MADFFSGIFDWVSELGDDASQFYDKMNGFFGDTGMDIIGSAAKETFGGGGDGKTKLPPAPDASKYVNMGKADTSAQSFASALSRESNKTGPLPSVDPKVIQREWVQRLKEFSQVAMETKV